MDFRVLDTPAAFYTLSVGVITVMTLVSWGRGRIKTAVFLSATALTNILTYSFYLEPRYSDEFSLYRVFHYLLGLVQVYILIHCLVSVFYSRANVSFVYNVLVEWPINFVCNFGVINLVFIVVYFVGRLGEEHKIYGAAAVLAQSVIGFYTSVKPLRRLEERVIYYDPRVYRKGFSRDFPLFSFNRRNWKQAVETVDEDWEELRIVQVSDVHLGPFMTTSRLKKLFGLVVEADPDLVFITGDMLTWSTQTDAGFEMVEKALGVLSPIVDKVYVCWGNHDLETYDELKSIYERLGIRVLADESVVTTIRGQRVRVLGAKVHHFHKGETLNNFLASEFGDGSDRESDVDVNLLLLHIPFGFKEIGDGYRVMTFSGHVHSGMLGWQYLGINWSVFRIAGFPDIYTWLKGFSKLYIHSGNGFYFIATRLGMLGEDTIFRFRYLPLSRIDATGPHSPQRDDSALLSD